MSIAFRNIQVPLFIKIEKNCLSDFYAILKEHGLPCKKPLVLTSPRFKKNISFLKNSGVIEVLDNSLSLACDIQKKIKDHDIVISIGGGKIIDLGKFVATKKKMSYVSVPTAPSNDGIMSPIAVLKNKKGMTESIGVNMPMGILVDLNLVASAPLKNIQAGIGDLISNYSALLDWRLAHAEKKEKIDDFAASLAYSAADLVYAQYRFQDKIDLREEKFLKTLINGLILSGIAMNIAGSSRPCSGSEHEISHAIDKLYPDTAPHGLQVAYAMLIAEKMREHDITDYINFYKSVGLPVSFKELGLSEEQIIEAILYAPQTRPDRYTILEKLNLNKKQIKETLYGL